VVGGRHVVGGRPVDSTSPASTRLVVGGADPQVITLNRQAMAQMHGAEVVLEIVPGATHLFEEPGTLEAVSGLARDWFVKHLPLSEPT